MAKRRVGNHPDFLACRWRVTYRWKFFDESYNFALDLVSIESLHTKLWGPKVAGLLTLTISGLSFGSLQTKQPFGCGPRGEAQSIL
jgi:hypothetical protein